MKKRNSNDFSVALGLTDYINPIMYLITSITLIINLDRIMILPYNVIYIMGVIVSLIFGFTIPTVKLFVGLGKMKFSLPVNLVFYVNSGIFLSGLMLIKNILDINKIEELKRIIGTLTIKDLLDLNLEDDDITYLADIYHKIGYQLEELVSPPEEVPSI